MAESPIIGEIITQYAEEVAFLWLLREKAIYAPNYSLDDLSELDNRIEANIDGLRIAGDAGWEICKESLSQEEAGEIFTAAVLAFERRNEANIQAVLAIGDSLPELSHGIVSALGWLPYNQAEGHVRMLLGSESPNSRRMGIRASAVHRRDPGHFLVDALTNADPLLRTDAISAVGVLGKRDLLPSVKTDFGVADRDCRFFAAWSAALLGDTAAVQVLQDLALCGGLHSEIACAVALRRMNINEAHAWIHELISLPESQKLAVIGVGVLGDPVFIPWLIQMMEIPEYSRVAGESFSMITGVDIAYEDLEGEWPEGFEAGPTENPEDEDVEMDPDEDLPWPKPELIKTWWKEHDRNFKKGKRYLCGKPMTIEHLQYVLRYGYQRQRNAAALELAIRQPGTPLFETRAPGFRQQKLLKY